MGGKSTAEKILLHIEKNLDKDLTLENIARELHYSKFYMARTFKNRTGCTLHQYIRSRRLEEAARKLVETGQPIIEIALESGYDSQQAFTHAFRQEYAYTPQEYRKTGKFVPKPDRISRKLSEGCTMMATISTKGAMAA